MQERKGQCDSVRVTLTLAFSQVPLNPTDKEARLKSMEMDGAQLWLFLQVVCIVKQYVSCMGIEYLSNTPVVCRRAPRGTLYNEVCAILHIAK